MSKDLEKYIITKPNSDQIIAKIKWSVSHAYETSGYPICGLYFPGGKVASCKGGGYDLRGTVLADWFVSEAGAKLKKLPANYGSGDNQPGFYGLYHYNSKRNKRQRYGSQHTRTGIDGGCGWDSVVEIMERLGYRITAIR